MDPTRAIIDGDLARVARAVLPWERLEGATVLLTGATGLVGGFLAECLLSGGGGRRGAKILVLARAPDRARARLAHLDSSRVQVVAHDIAAPLALGTRADFVVHAGAPARPEVFARDPVGAYTPNVLGTHHLLEWAASHEVERFLFLSSGAANGPVPASHGPYDEDVYAPLDPLDPYSCYAESKRMGEAECAAWHRSTGLATVVARLGHSYGPGLTRSDTRSFAEFVHCAVDGRDIVLRTDGSAERPFCYLADAVTGLLTVLLSGEPGRPYFVVNEDATCSIRELAQLVADLAPPPGITVKVRPDGAPGVHLAAAGPLARPTSARLRALGWRPEVGLVEGFGRTVAALRAG